MLVQMSASRRASRGFHRLVRLIVTRIPTGLVLALMLTGGAAAGPFEDGLAADDRGDYATAARLYRLAAEQGVAEAGDLYGDGLAAADRGDYATAARLYRLAAEQGLAEAQNNLGVLYGDGKGVAQDYTEAVKWYRLAAEQGSAEAQNNLGALYGDGKGVAQDYTEAVKWYRLAAEQGVAEAQNNLGALYGDGKGVPQDYVQADMWFNLAASKSSRIRDMAISDREAVASKMTPEQLAEAQRLAREWMPK
jgi:uncharacterized protein